MLYTKFEELLLEINKRFKVNVSTENEVKEVCKKNGFEYESRDGIYFVSRNKNSGELGCGTSSDCNNITEYRTILSLDKFLSEIQKMVDSLIKNPEPNDENTRMFMWFKGLNFMTTEYEYELSKYDEFTISFTGEDSNLLYDIYKGKQFLEKAGPSKLYFQLNTTEFNALSYEVFWILFLKHFNDSNELVALSETLKLVDYIDNMKSLQHHMRREKQAMFEVDEKYARFIFNKILDLSKTCVILKK